MGRGGRRRWLVVGGAFAVAALAFVALRPASEGTTGETAPSFRVEDVRDPAKTVTLDSAEGRPVVLNFWASWCAPCRKELPALRSAHQEWGDRVAFIGMDNQDSRTGAVDLLKEFRITYPSGYDPSGKVASAYRLLGMPTTIFISADGRIVARHTGELTRQKLNERLQALVGPGSENGR